MTTTSKTWLFDKPGWSELWRHIATKLDALSITNVEIRERFANSFGNLKNPPIIEKMNLLCQSHGLPDYSKEIRAISLMRNGFMHGKPTQDSYDGYHINQIRLISEHLLLKLLFRLLNFYRGWPDVHGSVTNDDLCAIN